MVTLLAISLTLFLAPILYIFMIYWNYRYFMMIIVIIGSASWPRLWPSCFTRIYFTNIIRLPPALAFRRASPVACRQGAPATMMPTRHYFGHFGAAAKYFWPCPRYGLYHKLRAEHFVTAISWLFSISLFLIAFSHFAFSIYISYFISHDNYQRAIGSRAKRGLRPLKAGAPLASHKAKIGFAIISWWYIFW